MKKTLAFLSLAAVLAAPLSAQAHRAWLAPTSTVLSGNDAWVGFDAGMSNGVFIADHAAMNLAGLIITAPDGSTAAPENMMRGRYRATFDLHLTQPGTWRVANVMGGYSATYKQGGEEKRWRGTEAELATAIPKDATEVKLTQSQRRLEIFATRGSPTKESLKITGKGLELEPVTHPNDLVAGEPATFKLMLDGKPAAGVEVEVVPGGNRYRSGTGEMKLTTDAQGAFTVKWPGAGMYWLEAGVRGGKASIPNAERNASYVTTLEVLPD